MVVRPSLKLLSPDQINNIHQYSIRILEDTGLKVASERALKIFSKSDAVRIKNDVVYIQRELVDQSIQTAPPNIEILKKTVIMRFTWVKNRARRHGLESV
ncbi:MAG TPA: hypothetical protein ENI20_16190 [Bacteroides sp.]|nr:hypothetical protein [Bacteroides sp.]